MGSDIGECNLPLYFIEIKTVYIMGQKPKRFAVFLCPYCEMQKRVEIKEE